MADASKFQSILDDFRLSSGTPGVCAGVRLGGDLHWAGSSADKPFPPVPRFPIYSVTKTLTAICVLRLHENGNLPVTTPITQLLPNLPLPDSITLTHLLQHTSGLRDYGHLMEYHTAVRAHPSEPWDDQQFQNAVVPLGLLFPPGAGWSYSNTGYQLLRLALQKATGKTFRQCIHDFLVTPLNLQGTFVAQTIEDWSTCVPGYGTEITSDASPTDIRPIYHPPWCAPGVVVSTPQDITQIFEALFAGSLLNEATLKMMLTLVPVPGHHPPAVTPSAGLGILADPDSPFGPSYGHGGGGPGYAVAVSVLPQFPLGRLAIATFVNSSSGVHPSQAEANIIRCLLDDK